MRIKVLKNLCNGCEICEMVCLAENEINPKRAKIKIQHEFYKVPKVFVCRQCKTPFCVEACEFDAFHELSNNVWRLDMKKCTLCEACIEACPFDAIFRWRDEILKCDLCDFEPKCVKYCPRGVLEMV
ncbi:MAG: 4Fe-4S binding protein [Candidatus Methanofastidiosia archaeon]